MKIFVNETAFTIRPLGERVERKPGLFVVEEAKAKQIWQLYKMLRDGQLRHVEELAFTVNNEKKTLEKLGEKFRVVQAAGGIVVKGESALFIHRLNKWDLPKGKVEAGEEVQEAAVREVEEECGVKAQLGRLIGITNHTYVRDGHDCLKRTYWYHMTCLDDGALAPQTAEAIEEVAWIPFDQVKDGPLTDTYENIRDIYRRFEGQYLHKGQ